MCIIEEETEVCGGGVHFEDHIQWGNWNFMQIIVPENKHLIISLIEKWVIFRLFTTLDNDT